MRSPWPEGRSGERRPTTTEVVISSTVETAMRNRSAKSLRWATRRDTSIPVITTLHRTEVRAAFRSLR